MVSRLFAGVSNHHLALSGAFYAGRGPSYTVLIGINGLASRGLL
jgi:hypothetical protein